MGHVCGSLRLPATVLIIPVGAPCAQHYSQPQDVAAPSSPAWCSATRSSGKTQRTWNEQAAEQAWGHASSGATTTPLGGGRVTSRPYPLHLVLFSAPSSQVPGAGVCCSALPSSQALVLTKSLTAPCSKHSHSSFIPHSSYTMPHKIGFVVVSSSGHEDGFSARELMVHAPTVSGWRSPR